jgi:hypothetical protein
MIAVLVLACAWLTYQKWQLELALRKALRVNEVVNKALDYILRKFSLNVRDPYTVRPGFDEKRCFHCFYPETHAHDADCSWLQLQPLVELLYPIRHRPATPPVQTARPTPGQIRKPKS